MRRHSLLGLCALFVAVGIVASACDGDDSGSAPTTTLLEGGASSGSSTSGASGGTSSGDPTLAPPKITTTSPLPNIIAGVAASAVKFAATGATPITFAITGGAAPAGMTLAADGTYSGTPTTPGDATFTVTATNSRGTDAVQLTQKVNFLVDAYVLLDNNRLAGFSTAFPQLANAPVSLVGVANGQSLVSVDRRPMNGQLYGLGFNATTKQVSLYALHPSSMSAVAVAAAQGFDTDIVGPGFGSDFNPAFDRMRVVTSAGQNFRVNPNNGALIDADIGSPGVQRDNSINGGSAVTASETAYTNNVINNGAITTQYTVSGTTLHIQNPSDNGTLTTPVNIPTVEALLGFDIAPGINVAASNQQAAGVGLAAVKISGQSTEQLASINLTTGALTSLGAFPFTGVRGLALLQQPNRSVIALATLGPTLIRFLENTPSTVTTQGMSNVLGTEQLIGIALRPATGQLYALGVNATANNATLYLVDPQTGLASVVGATSGIAFVSATGAVVDLPDPATAGYGFDFNPTVDRIRVVTSTGLNFRINPATGAPVDGDPNMAGTNTDPSLSGGSTGLDAVAYTNGHPATLPGTLTTEYGLNATTNTLHVVTNPTGGVIAAPINVTLNGSSLDFTAVNGFDIPQSVTTATANAPVTEGSAYAALTVGGVTSLYRINLMSGAATTVGVIGAGMTPVRGIAIGQ